MRGASTLRVISLRFLALATAYEASALFSSAQTIAKRSLGNSGRRARVVSHRLANKVCSHKHEAQFNTNGRQEFVNNVRWPTRAPERAAYVGVN